MFKKKKDPFQKEITRQTQRDKVSTYYCRVTIPIEKIQTYFRNPKFEYSRAKRIISVEISYYLTKNLAELINTAQRKSPPFYTSLTDAWFNQEVDKYGRSFTLTIAFWAPVNPVKKIGKVNPLQIRHVYLQVEGRDIPIISQGGGK